MLLPWVHVFAMDLLWLQVDPSTDINHVAPPFYYAVSIGLLDITRIFIDVGVDVHALNEFYGYTLQAASFCSHKKVVQMLLDVGVGIDAEEGYYGHTLQVASWGGHVKVVQMLLEAIMYQSPVIMMELA